MRIIKRILLGLLAFILVAVLAGYLWLRSLNPSYSGEVSLPGLKAPVEVVFDEHAVPHIKAQSEEDLFRAFGYLRVRNGRYEDRGILVLSG